MTAFNSIKTKTVPFGKGEAKITVTGFIYNEQYGGLTLSIVPEIEIILNGQVVTKDNYASSYDYPNANELQRELMDDVYNVNNWDCNQAYTRIGKATTPGLLADAINDIVKSFELEVETEYALYKGLKTPAEKAALANQEEIQTAQSIVDQAEKLGVEKLLTAAQAHKRAMHYNDVVNEGGDGYIPRPITIEQYQSAKAFLLNQGV